MKTLLALVLTVSSLAHAQDRAYLDKPYPLKGLHPQISDPAAPRSFWNPFTPSRSNTLKVLQAQTPVKSQASRGTCSMFSSTALLEAMLVIKKGLNPAQLDLSEEWIEYLIVRNATMDGGFSSSNFANLVRYGSPAERHLPYIGETWESVNSSSLAKERCSRVPANRLKGCLLAHRDPRLMEATDQLLMQGELRDEEFLKARRAAALLRDTHLTNVDTGYSVGSTGQIKKLLADGIPLTLDIDFYYGAWNHRQAATLCDASGNCIGRDMDNWDRGIIGYPERNSLDRKLSMTAPTGHSVVIIGYDDKVEVTTQQKVFENGRLVERQFTYKGVYYFKNSWGTDSFGRHFQLDGKTYPGYGMITQQYAHERGAFFKLYLK